jgi:hypothetical protein
MGWRGPRRIVECMHEMLPPASASASGSPRSPNVTRSIRGVSPDTSMHDRSMKYIPAAWMMIEFPKSMLIQFNYTHMYT